MRWQIYHDCTNKTSEEVIEAILRNRGLTSQKSIHDFLNPPSPFDYSPQQVGIDQSQLDLALDTIKSSIQARQPILIYGDYDADGITATAILWETLHGLGANVIPFIPSREDHGYGLSINGLTDALSLTSTPPIIITVDNGIVAFEAATWLKKQGIPLIITDHHTSTDTFPESVAVVHSTQISGAGVAWFVSKQLSTPMAKSTLELACIGTIADMMPLLGINRSLAKFGLESLNQTSRPGIKAIFDQAQLDSSQVLTTHHINYIVAPRLNAMGRLEHALDSLRLLCTKNQTRAKILAAKLGSTNLTRQNLTVDLLNQALLQIDVDNLQPILVVEGSHFHEGVIGLIAGKLVENFYRPSIVISKKDKISKASARSIKGVNITEIIRSQSHLLLGAGGHPMAAGFSIETHKLDSFKQSITEYALANIDQAIFNPTLDIDCSIDLSTITLDLYHACQQLTPFGTSNHEPVFAINGVKVISVQVIGKDENHLKIKLDRLNNLALDAIWFNYPKELQLHSGQVINLAGTISLNTWRDKKTLQFLVKDINLDLK